MLKKKSVFISMYIIIFGLFIFVTVDYFQHICSERIFINEENIISCISGSVAMPTDSEKNCSYTKPFHQNINYERGVFLTFDDGPSRNTLRILDILRENNVKATFFIVGKEAERNPQIIKKISEEGMCILSHTYTHDYRIYSSLNTYLEDLDSCNQVIEKLTREIPMPIIRFPGGSTNTVGSAQIMRKIKDTLKNRRIRYVDWNVSSADASAALVSMDRIQSNVINQCKNKNMAVILMHDGVAKTTTVEALPYIIKDLKEKGFVFRTFKDITEAEEAQLIRSGIIGR